MEEFRDLDQYYAVSNFGRVFSKRSNKIMSPRLDSKKRGYQYVTLTYDGIKKTKQIHRLVAILFVPNPNNLPIINHKDENPSNNHAENLEWCTHSYNLSYGSRVQKEHATKVANAICNAPRKVVQKDLDGNILNIFKSANEAGKILNIASTHIIDCCNGKVTISKKGTWVTRTAGGYKFSWL